MENVSIGLDPDLMVDVLIMNVRVIRIRIVYATYKGKHHNGISLYPLENKWVIDPDKAKHTVGCTTQEKVILSLKPIKRQYKTDLISQRLRRLN